MKNLVYLGGTCGNNNWRTRFIDAVTASGVPAESLFNPVVADWNAEAQEREEAAKREATHHLYYIADPQQEGNPVSAYSMVEATMALYDHPETAVVVFDASGMPAHAAKASAQTARVLRARFPDAHILDSFDAAVQWFIKQLAPA